MVLKGLPENPNEFSLSTLASVTKEINDMIKDIQTQTDGAVNSMESGIQEVDRGREMADKAGVALGEIPPVVEWEVEEGRHTVEFTSERLSKIYRTKMDVQSGQRWQLRMNMQTGKFIQINVLTNERKEQILVPIE